MTIGYICGPPDWIDPEGYVREDGILRVYETPRDLSFCENWQERGIYEVEIRVRRRVEEFAGPNVPSALPQPRQGEEKEKGPQS